MTMPDGSGGQEPAYPPQPSYPAPGPTGYDAPPPGPVSYAPPAPPPPPNRGRRTGIVILGTLVILIVLVVGGLAFFRDRISGDVNALQVGDCIDEPSSTDTITEVQHQPCSEPHDGEVFALLTYPGENGATYPGASAFDDFVGQQCLPAVQAYTAKSLDEIAAAGLSYAYFYPTTSSWTDSNDRGVTCYLERADGTKLVGSVRVTPASP